MHYDFFNVAHCCLYIKLYIESFKFGDFVVWGNTYKWYIFVDFSISQLSTKFRKIGISLTIMSSYHTVILIEWISGWLLFNPNNFSAISWREKVIFSTRWWCGPICTRPIRLEATHTNDIVFGLIWSGLEPTTYGTRGEHANHYTTDAVYVNRNRWLKLCCYLYILDIFNYIFFQFVLDTSNPPKTNKMKIIDTQRPPGNPIFHKNKGRNSANRSTGSFSKIVNTSMCSSSIDTNASSLSIAKNSENDTKENSVSGKVFPSSSSYLYKSKDQTLS